MKIICAFVILFSVTSVFGQTKCPEGYRVDAKTGRCVQVEDKTGIGQESNQEIFDDLNDKLNQNHTNNSSQDNNSLALIKDNKETLRLEQEKTKKTIKSVGIAAASATLLTCPTVSAGLMMLAAKEVIKGEIKSLEEYQNKVKDLKERMKKVSEEYKKNRGQSQKMGFALKTQIEAFQILAEAEDAIAAASNKKHKRYKRAKVLYNIAKIKATAESIFSALHMCVPAPFSAAVKKRIKKVYQKKGGNKESPVYKGINDASFFTHASLISPMGRALISHKASRLSKDLEKISLEQKEIALNRAKTIRAIASQLVYGSAFDKCEDKDRSDPSKPQCYCFTQDWRRNPNRSASQICNQHWGRSYTPAATDYNEFLSGTGSSQSCITKKYQDDPKCNCIATNSCLSLSLNFDQLKSFPGIRAAVSSTTSEANKFFQGKLSSGELDKLGNGNSAFNKNIAKALAKNERTKKLAKEFALASKKFDRSLNNKLAKTTKSLGSNETALGLKSPFSGNVKETLTKTNQEKNKDHAEINKIAATKSSIKNLNNVTATPSFGDLDFSSLEPGAGLKKGGVKIQETSSEESGDQRFGSQTSPIAKDEGQTLFEQISDSYHQVGLRKLFATRKKIKAE